MSIFKYISLFALLIAGSGTAFADLQTTIVTEPNLKTIGGGMENRKTGEVLSLACAGEFNRTTNEFACNVVRLVYIKADRNAAYWVGPEFSVESENSVPNKTDFKRATKQIRKRYHEWVANDHAALMNSPAGRLGLGIGVGGFFVAAGAMAITANPICMAAWIPVIVGVNVIRKKQFDFGITDNNRAGTWATFSSQEGWSWAEKTRKVKSKTFDGLLQYLETQTGGIPVAEK